MLSQKNKIFFGIIILMSIFLINITNVSAQTFSASQVSYCCEKTKTGAWCQNAPQSECDTAFRSVPTSCEATSYCKLGCCYDSQEGTCMRNTPQKVCNDNNGIWAGESATCEIPQCQLGCCLIGDQAAFVSQIRCKNLSALYGLETNYRTDITSEAECIASATSDVKGACVFEKDFEKTCKFITQKDCATLGSGGGNSSTDFREGYL